MTGRRFPAIVATSILAFLPNCSSSSKPPSSNSNSSVNSSPSAHNNNSATNTDASVASSSEDSEPYSVHFKIQESTRRKVRGGEEVTWLATHESAAGIARFQISLILEDPSSGVPVAASKCAFIRETNSQSAEFWRQLAKALEAKKPRDRKPPANRLDFDVVILGQGVARGVGGGFSSGTQGDWIVTKVFVADGKGEFYLNLNSKDGVAEISEKDPDYGDVVLRELSRIF